MRKRITPYALVIDLSPPPVIAVGCAASDKPHHHDHATPTISSDVQTPQRCRAEAFVDASNIIISVVEIAMALPANTLNRTRAEFDTALYIALPKHYTADCTSVFENHYP